MTLSGNIFVGILRYLKKTKTHRFLGQQYLSQIRSDHYKTFSKSSSVYPKMIQTKKQTNKQIITLDPNYLSQIKWECRNILGKLHVGVPR